MKYTIYMLKNEHHSNLFMNYKWNMEHGGVSLDQYEPVYSGEITSGDSTHDIGGALERIFNLLNSNRPADYNCRSLSVSDVVHLENFGYWYCDTIGFKKIQTPVAPWAAYCQYLHDWADAHADKGFEGCCPVCYDEFLECEYNEEE